REQTVLFADLSNFTSVAERLSPEELFRVLNAYLEEASAAVTDLRGIVDKFVGDGVVAFWGPPLESDHATGACLAALRLVNRAGNSTTTANLPTLRVRVGIASGPVLVGNVGSRSKYNYTVMGDAANLASRLEGANKFYGTQILVSAATANAAKAITRKIDVVRVIGRNEPVELFEVLGEPGDAEAVARCEKYGCAMRLYESRDWQSAAAAFAAIGDPPSLVLSARCALFTRSDPGPGWDGVWNFETK
ncbi:MAG: adenylate/guanylate cyclase domain-containing protein, partial [Tepidisphaeraceae bacterium]